MPDVLEYMVKAPLGVKVSDIKTHFEIRLTEARLILQELVREGKIIRFKVHNCTYYTPKDKYSNTHEAMSAQRAAQEGPPRSPEEYKARILDHLANHGEGKLKDLRNGVRIRRIYLNTFLTELLQEEKIIMNRRSDGIFVGLKPTVVVQSIADLPDALEQLYLQGKLDVSAFQAQEVEHLQQLQAILGRFGAFNKETKFNLSRHLKITVEECTHHLASLVRYGLIEEASLGDLKMYKRTSGQPSQQEPLVESENRHPWRMYPTKKPEPQLVLPVLEEPVVVPAKRNGVRHWVAASLVMLLATACGITTPSKPGPAPITATLGVSDPYASERLSALGLMALQTETLNSCEAFTQAVPGPVWRQTVQVDDTSGYSNLLTLGVELPIQSGMALSNYVQQDNQTAMPQVRVMLTDYLKPVQLPDPQNSGSTLDLQGRFNAGLMFDPQTQGYWAFTEFGNYRIKDGSGAPSPYVTHQVLSKDGKLVRFPPGQKITLTHAFSSSENRLLDVEVSADRWLKLPVPVAVGHLSIQASRYYLYDQENGKPVRPQLVENGPPLTMDSVVPLINTQGAAQHQVAFTRTLWYPNAKDSPPGSSALNAFMSQRNDMLIGLDTTGQVGKATLNADGTVQSSTMFPPDQWNLGSVSSSNAKNCVGPYTYVDKGRHDMVTAKVGALPLDPVPLVASIKTEPYTSLQLLVGKQAALTAQVTHPSGRAVLSPVQWVTSNASVAAVNETGRITGNRPGTATVYAKLAGRAAGVTVNVKTGIVEAERVPISAAGQRSYVIKKDGYVYGFGSGNMLGLGEAYSGKVIQSPTRLPSIRDALALDSNDFNTFAVTADGSVWGWGDNQFGQLGNGNQFPSHVPVKVPITDVVKLRTCMADTFALKADGTVWAWGDNSMQQLSKTSQMVYTAPIQIPTLKDVKNLTCFAFVKTNNSLWTLDPETANFVQKTTGITDVVSAFSVFMLKTDGTVLGAGYNYDPNLMHGNVGWLGTGSKIEKYDTPVSLPNLKNIKKITSQNGSTLMLDTSNQLFVFGNNQGGQLGLGHTRDQGTAIKLNTSAKLLAVSAGSGHVLGVDSSGKLWSWGQGGNGQLGYSGSPVQSSPRLTSITGVMLP